MSSPDNTTDPQAAAAGSPDPAARPTAKPRGEAPAAAKPLMTPPALLAGPNVVALLRSFRRRWLLASTMGLVCGVVAATAVWFLLPPAKNSAQVMLHMPIEMRGRFHDHPEKVDDFATFQTTQMALIKSRMVLNAALRQPKVDQLAILRSTSLEPVEFMEREIRIDSQGSREILRIAFYGDDIEELKILANAVTQSYLDEVVFKQTKQRQERLDELKKIQVKYKDKLNSNRRILNELAKKSGVGDSKNFAYMQILYQERLSVARQTLLKVEDDIRQMKVREQLASASGDQTVSIPATLVDVQVSKDPGIERRLARIKQLEDTLAESIRRAKDPDNTPAVKSLKNDLEAERIMMASERSRLRPKIDAEMREQGKMDSSINLASLKSNLEHARLLEKSLTNDIDTFSKAIADAPSGQLSMKEMEFDLEQAESEVRSVTAAIMQLEVELEAPARVSRLPGEVIGHKADNLARKAQLSAAAGVVFLGLAIFGVAFLEFRSRRVHSVDEVSHGLGVHIVGTVPACPKRIRSNVAGTNVSYWKSMLTESVDAARTMLLHYARREDLRIVMVTSANGGEGKTSLSSHLAVSMARSGRKTLLIDCDLRNPSSNKLFNVPVEPGLASVLRGEIAAEEALHATQAAGLWLMPAGTCDGEALAMLAQDGMAPIFERLRRQFDFIIVDSSPVLPVADSLMVAQQVDGVIFAVLREVSRLPKVHEAYQKLVSLGVRMLGAVVNGTSSEIYGYGYGYSYNSRYLNARKSRE